MSDLANALYWARRYEVDGFLPRRDPICAGYSALLRSLRGGAGYAARIGRRAGVHEGNVGAYLRRLAHWGFVRTDGTMWIKFGFGQKEVTRWELTSRGRTLADLLAAR